MSQSLGSKRDREDEGEAESDDIGPLPTSATAYSSKKRKGICGKSNGLASVYLHESYYVQL